MDSKPSLLIVNPQKHKVPAFFRRRFKLTVINSSEAPVDYDPLACLIYVSAVEPWQDVIREIKTRFRHVAILVVVTDLRPKNRQAASVAEGIRATGCYACFLGNQSSMSYVAPSMQQLSGFGTKNC
ncbi:hypothetical protein HC928_14600 [bacterium]|nr:hypothetical protein [bacterium]